MTQETITWHALAEKEPEEGVTVLLRFASEAMPVVCGYRNRKLYYPMPRHLAKNQPYAMKIAAWAELPTGACVVPKMRKVVA